MKAAPFIFKAAGLDVLIDQADAPAVMAHVWTVVHVRKSRYPRAKINGRIVKLHQFLMPNEPMVDHKDGDGLNNQRENLRPCNRFQNQWNSRKHRTTTSSQFKGVSKIHDRVNSFEVSIRCNKRRYRLGRFFDEVAAALAYDIASLTLHKEFSRPNFSITEAALVHPESLKLAADRCRRKGLILEDLKLAA